MSKFSDCLAPFLESGVLTSKEADKYSRMFDNLNEHMGGKNGEDAGKAVSAMIQHDADNMVRKAMAFDRVSGIPDVVLARSDVGGKAGVADLVLNKLADVKHGHATAYSLPFSETLSRFTDGELLRLTEVKQESMIKHMLGEVKLNDKFGELADSIVKSVKVAKANQRALGGSYLYDAPKGTVPVDIQRGALQNMEFKTFSRDIEKFVDMNHLIKNVPTALQHPDGLEGYLESAFKALKNGAKTLGSAERGGQSPSNFKRDFLQNLHTSSSEGWKTLHRKYGQGASGSFNIVMEHQNRILELAAETAELEAFGGSVTRYSKAVEASLQKHNKLGGLNKLLDDTTYVRGGYDRVWNPETAEGITAVVLKLSKLTNFVKALSPILLTGSAQIMAAFTDPLYRASAAKYYGLGTHGAHKTLGAGLDVALNDLSRGNNRFVARLGLSTSHMSDLLQQGMRGYSSTLGVENTEKVTAAMLRASGLPWITDLGRAMNVKNISMDLAEDAVNTPFEKLGRELRRDMQLFGISSKDWDIMRANGLSKESDNMFMSPASLAKEHPEQARKLASLFARVEEMGTPTKSQAIEKFRAKWNASSAFEGMVADMLSTFQGFNGSMFERWLRRGAGKKQFLAKMGAYSYVIGLINVTAFNAKNNETTNYADFETHVEALNRGGVTSYFGDFISAVSGMAGYGYHQSFAQALGKKAGGVALGTVADLGTALISNAGKATRGKDTKFWHDMRRLGERFNFAGKFALTSALYEETLGAYLGEITDKKQFKKQVKRQKSYLKKKEVKKLTKVLGLTD